MPRRRLADITRRANLARGRNRFHPYQDQEILNNNEPHRRVREQGKYYMLYLYLNFSQP